MVSCCITLGDSLCVEFKALRLGSSQPWWWELESHKRTYGLRNICTVPVKGGGNCKVGLHVSHEVCPSVLIPSYLSIFFLYTVLKWLKRVGEFLFTITSATSY